MSKRILILLTIVGLVIVIVLISIIGWLFFQDLTSELILRLVMVLAKIVTTFGSVVALILIWALGTVVVGLTIIKTILFVARSRKKPTATTPTSATTTPTPTPPTRPAPKPAKTTPPLPWDGIVLILGTVAIITYGVYSFMTFRESRMNHSPSQEPTWGEVATYRLGAEPTRIPWKQGASQIRIDLNYSDKGVRKYQLKSGDRIFVLDGSEQAFRPYKDKVMELVSLDGKPLDIIVQWR